VLGFPIKSGICSGKISEYIHSCSLIDNASLFLALLLTIVAVDVNNYLIGGLKDVQGFDWSYDGVLKQQRSLCYRTADVEPVSFVSRC